MVIQNQPRNLIQARSRVERAAQDLAPQDIVERGSFLGAGMGGGAYQIEHLGQQFVAKQWGHPESAMGAVSPTTAEEYAVFALKQSAVQNALAIAGFPLPISAVLGQDARWVLMEKVEGMPVDQLSADEQSEAKQQADWMAQQMEPVIIDTLGQLAAQRPDSAKSFEYFPDMQGNMRFARGPQGIQVSGAFDPIM